ncbi:hypothetical protein [Mycoplasma sp. 3341]|uniref:hypothetical protein n=1 Tax=Mycoplasma sp. 3341 TaxID=3447506 RepID=UPI003F65CBE3
MKLSKKLLSFSLFTLVPIVGAVSAISCQTTVKEDDQNTKTSNNKTETNTTTNNTTNIETNTESDTTNNTTNTENKTETNTTTNTETNKESTPSVNPLTQVNPDVKYSTNTLLLQWANSIDNNLVYANDNSKDLLIKALKNNWTFFYDYHNSTVIAYETNDWQKAKEANNVIFKWSDSVVRPDDGNRSKYFQITSNSTPLVDNSYNGTTTKSSNNVLNVVVDGNNVTVYYLASKFVAYHDAIVAGKLLKTTFEIDNLQDQLK